MNPLRRAYLRLAVPPNPFRFDPSLEGFARQLCRQVGPAEWVLNLGSGRTHFGGRVVNLDLQRSPPVDICGNGEALPFRDSVFSGVLLRGVLEHVRSLTEVQAEVLRVLAPNGFLYVEVPFLQPLHLSPEDNRRFTLPGLRLFFAALEESASGVQIGPGSALAWVLRNTLAALLSCGSERAYAKLLTLAGWATFWLKYLDKLIVSAPYVADSASAVFFLGRKRG